MPSLLPLRIPLWSIRRRLSQLRLRSWFHQGSVYHCCCTDSLKKPVDLEPLGLTDLPKAPADHRSLGTSLDLFSNSIYSPGSPLFHPNGAHIFHKLQAFLRAQYPRYGLREVITPTIYKKSLWEESGHWENYRDDMYKVTGRGAAGQKENREIGDDEEYGLKPMNCPGHCLLFKSQKRSYRDLPIGYADFSPLHRNEISGALSGLTRVRRFHQDDGHIFCRPDQVEDEILKTLRFVEVVYKTFELGPYKLVLSTRPLDQYIGTIEEWDRAEAQLVSALHTSAQNFSINSGDGAFYGPKIDIILSDSHGKQHQTATIQLDFQLPQRFGLSYKAPTFDLAAKFREPGSSDTPAESDDVVPVMIHRAVLGSFERFMALLIEHYQGHWPFWLSPRQAIILTIGQDEHTLNYAAQAATALSGSEENDNGKPLAMRGYSFKIDTDFSARGISKKIAEAKAKHYNLVCVIGAKEAENKTIRVDVTGQLKSSITGLNLRDRSKMTLKYLAETSPRDSSLAKEKGMDIRAIPFKTDKLQHFMTLLCETYL